MIYNIMVNISPVESLIRRKWCLNNNIKYCMAGHTFDCVKKFDEETDPMDVDLSALLKPNERMPIGFQFLTAEDAMAFKLRWM